MADPNPKPCYLRQGEAKERFNEIQQERSQLATKFSNNLLDATKAYKRLVTRKDEVEGAPLLILTCHLLFR